MTMQATDSLQAFAWTRQPEAERLVRGIIEDFIARCDGAAHLARQMTDHTATRFGDWIDHIVAPATAELEEKLAAAGYVKSPTAGAPRCWVQEKGMFPRIVLGDGAETAVAIKAESVADFAAANGIEAEFEGPPLSAYRRLHVCSCDGTALFAVERHGYQDFTMPAFDAAKAIRRLHHLELFRTRQREFPTDEEGFDEAERLLRASIADLGVDLTCDLFFFAEREYWQRRNRAAQAQKRRQDRLGLGWANHDHHTYRSSRRSFTRLISIFELLGFELRERFYAGIEAGWGAQVLEQQVAGIVIFADVDLSADELAGDFSHQPLHERNELGTVGLWCALHGEAILEAGMHHLECQFDFEALKMQMEQQEGIRVMKPFTDYSYLRQAFTEGERWPVREERIAMLLNRGQITEEQAKEFWENGAIGSHLENLERNEGFKGFNQKGVSEIIAATDPRLNRAG